MAKMSIEEANATLTAPGQMFEIEEIDIRGIKTRIWKNCPDSLRVVLDLSRGHGDKDFLIYEDERTTFEEHYRIAASIARALEQHTVTLVLTDGTDEGGAQHLGLWRSR